MIVSKSGTAFRETGTPLSSAPKPGALSPALHLARRLHGAALRRLHLALDGARALVTAPDGTTGKHELADLTIASANRDAGVHFLSTPWSVLRWTHAAVLPDGDFSRWTFVDLGAGKGRAMLSAAKLPYARIVGVEFAAELAAEARTNFDAEGHDPARVAIHEGDASQFSLPDGPLVVFLFNPFGPPVLDAVVERIAERARTTGQSIRIAYLNPEHAATFGAHPAFRRRALSLKHRLVFGVLSPYRLQVFEAGAPNEPNNPV